MEIELIRIFVKVIQAKSFSAAALNLKLPKSTVSRAVAKMEIETGTKLIVRTTRSLSLTPAGKDFYEACLPAVFTLEEAHKNLMGKDKQISGLVKITAPEDLGYSVIANAVAHLSIKYPGLNFEFNFTDGVIDIIKDGYDVAIRLGTRKDSGLKLRQAGEVVLIAVASPKYLAKNNKILEPSDLKTHVCLSHFWSKHWLMKSSKGKIEIPIRPKTTGNHMLSLLKMAIAGNGVAFVPKYLCETYISSGKLIHILPDWKSPPILVSIITPFAPSTVMRVKVTVDAIYEALQIALKHD